MVQLSWHHQFQFAGYYAAQWQGFYEEAGLQVALRPGADGSGFMRTVDEVAAGRAQFGIGGADILFARKNGVEMVALATILQHSPASYYATGEAGLRTVDDFTRLRVARRPGDMVDAEFQAMLWAEGIDPASVPRPPPEVRPATLTDLAEGRVDVLPGYSTRTPYQAQRLGLSLQSLSARTYGIDFYGDTLFTTRAFAETDPDLIGRFVGASLRGWRYALDHPAEIADRLAETYEPGFEIDDFRAFLDFQIDAVRTLIDPYGERREIGHVNPGRWRHTHQALARAGLVDGRFDAGRFVFDPEAFQESRRERWVTWLAAGGGGLGALAGLLALLSMVLRRRVARATQRLSEAHAHLSALFEASPEAMLIVDADGTCLQLNQKAAQRLDAEAKALINRNVFDVMDPEIARHRRNMLNSAVDTGQVVHSCDEHQGRCFENTIVPIAGEDGPMARAAVFSHDVTNWRVQEQKLQQARAQAEQASRVKSQFIAIMAHELRTPLNAIIGFSQMMKMKVFGPIGDRHYEDYVDDVIASGEHMLSLINDLLELSRMEAGTVELEVEEVDPAEPVSAARALVQEQAGAKGLTLSTDIDPALPPLLADRRALKQMLLNLLTNAVKFTPDGGRVGVEARRLPDGSLALCVTDTGVGIAEEEIARVLEPFQQGRAGRTSAELGAGLGLTLVKSLIEQHGGRLELDSRPDHGTTATLIFPPEGVADGGRPADRSQG
ncbi:MAG: ABC transporter substrate-binding protein [Alphaproteobacteria bacterium]|nr:ABC transporter substrate-binding protein [Alphaproteobacteria bacterium]